MSISFTPFTKQQLMPQEEKLEVGNTEANFYWFTQRNQSSRTPYLLNTRCSQLFDLSWSPCNDRKKWSYGESLLPDKEYDAGAEVTKDTHLVVP
jgi:alanine dehydrogenase